MLDIHEYKSIIFDCDGVILNSNKLKTRAFRLASISFGQDASNSLVEYHLKNGGISRYEKFDYFLTSIVSIDCKKKDEYMNKMLEIYSMETEMGLIDSEMTCGLEKLRENLINSSWSIVSGGDQEQLRFIFRKKGIVKLFDAGIFGSPDNKNEIINRELIRGNLKLPALFLGDSALDHKVSLANKLDFVFVSDWTEFQSYKDYCNKNSIKIISKVLDLIID